jgi:hypothetical protein
MRRAEGTERPEANMRRAEGTERPEANMRSAEGTVRGRRPVFELRHCQARRSRPGWEREMPRMIASRVAGSNEGYQGANREDQEPESGGCRIAQSLVGTLGKIEGLELASAAR